MGVNCHIVLTLIYVWMSIKGNIYITFLAYKIILTFFKFLTFKKFTLTF